MLCLNSCEEIPHAKVRDPSKMVNVKRASEGRHTETIFTEINILDLDNLISKLKPHLQL